MMLSNIEAIECITCHCDILLRTSVVESLRRTKNTFYCMNGHSQGFYGKNAVEKENDALKEQIAAEQRRVANAVAEADRARAAAVAAERECRLTKNKCKHCPKRFDSPAKLAAHVRRVHEKTLMLPAVAGKSN